MPDPTCPVCDRPVVLAAGAQGEGTHDTVRVLAAGVPVARCDAGHVVVPDDAVDATERAVDGRLTTARRPRLLGRHQRCGSCGAELVLPGFRSERVVTVEQPGAPTWTLAFDVPLLRCPDCAVENLPVEVRADVTDAVLAAMGAAAGMPPDAPPADASGR